MFCYLVKNPRPKFLVVSSFLHLNDMKWLAVVMDISYQCFVVCCLKKPMGICLASLNSGPQHFFSTDIL